MNVGVLVLFKVSKGDGVKREESEWMSSKDGESLVGVGKVGVSDAFREFHNHEFANRVLDVDAVGDAFIVKKNVGVNRDGGDWVKNEGGGGGARGRSRGSVNIVHDVARGAVKLEFRDFKRHVAVAGRLRRG